MEEQEIERIVDKKFQEIIAEEKADRELRTTKEIRKTIKGMKDTKTGDKNNWKAERIKEGGKMVQILATLSDRVEEENKISIKWRETKINSVYKGGNKERMQESQRGVFLMNMHVNYMKHNECNNRKTKTRTYKYLYADAERCFDIFWLKDSLVEIKRIGYNINDIKMLYKINKTTAIVIDTTIRNTEIIETTDVVKKGSIFGPTMCCSTAAKSNDVREKVD